MEVELLERFFESISTNGLAHACREYISQLGFDGEVEALTELNRNDKINILSFARNSAKADWVEGNDAHILLSVFRNGIESGFGLKVEQVFELAHIVWSHVGGEKDYNLTVNAVARFVSGHQETFDEAGELVFSKEGYWCFVPEIFPIVYKNDHKKWSCRFIKWYDSFDDVAHRRAGLTVLGNLDVGCADFSVDDVYDRTRQALQLNGIEGVGLACYFVCRRWMLHPVRGKDFELLLREILSQMEGLSLCNMAFLEHTYVKEASEEEIKLRLNDFARINPVNDRDEGLDLYLSEVVKVKEFVALDFLERRIAECPDVARDKSILPKTFHELYMKSEDLRSHVITKWLLSPEAHMMSAVQKLSSCDRDQGALRAHVVSSLIPREDSALRINLLRHSIARLFQDYSCCTSFAISCISLLNDDELEFVEKDFFMMVVMNFPDLVSQEYQRFPKDDRTAMFLKREMDAYTEIKKVVAENKCPELEPSVEDRLAFSEILRERNEEIMKEAKKRSLLSLFGPELKILYGNGAIYEQYGAGGSVSRQEMQFSRSHAQIRIPGLMNFYEMSLQTVLDEMSYSNVYFKCAQ